MPYSAFVSRGIYTAGKSGPGVLYGIVTSGASGGTVVLQDSVSIGTTPNYVTLPNSVGSNLGYVTLLATGQAFPFHGAPFQIGLTVAATSNCHVTVSYD